MFVHVSNVSPRQTEAYSASAYSASTRNPAPPGLTTQWLVFDAGRWAHEAKKRSMPNVPNSSYYDFLDNQVPWSSLPGNINNLQEYIDSLHGEMVLLGSEWVEDLDDERLIVAHDRGWRLVFSPHIDDSSRPAKQPRCYVGTDLARRLLAHRYKHSRYVHYADMPNAFIYLISPGYRSLLHRVGLGGLGHGNTPDLAFSWLPLPIAGCYEVTWNGPGLANAVFTQINL